MQNNQKQETEIEVIAVIVDAQFWYVPETNKNDKANGQLCLWLDYRFTLDDQGHSGNKQYISNIDEIRRILKDGGIDFGQCYINNGSLKGLIDTPVILVRTKKGEHRFNRFYNSELEK